MKLEKVLGGYDKRVNSLGVYYMITGIAMNQKKFSEFNSIEFFNLLIQTLLFIFYKSLSRKPCLYSDIREYIQELNILVYKKDLDNEYLDNLTQYVVNNLSNLGKDFKFPFYDIEKEEFVDATFKIINHEEVLIENQVKLKYSLSEQGYKILLSSKEYDELYQIRVSQFLARLRLAEDDYVGAKEDVNDIINNLSIQYQKINSYINSMRNDVYYIRENKYSDVMDESLEVLIKEMGNYDELKHNTILKINDKEEFLKDVDDDTLNDKVKVIRKQLYQLKDLSESISNARKSASDLIRRVQVFREEFSEILVKLLKAPILKKYDFKKELLERLESSPNLCFSLMNIYRPLGKISLPNRFEINRVYEEQPLLRQENITPVVLQDAADYEIVADKEKEKNIDFSQNYYYLFTKTLFTYGLDKYKFNLKDFFNEILKKDKGLYLELTKDSMLLRSVVMFFALQDNILNIKKIVSMVKNIPVSSTTEYDLETVVARIMDDTDTIIYRVGKFKSGKIIDDEFIINTEINLADMSAVKFTLTNVEFELIES